MDRLQSQTGHKDLETHKELVEQSWNKQTNKQKASSDKNIDS